MHFGERHCAGHSGWVIGALIALIGFTIGYAFYFLFIVIRSVIKGTYRLGSKPPTAAPKPGSPTATRKEKAPAGVVSLADYKRNRRPRMPVLAARTR